MSVKYMLLLLVLSLPSVSFAQSKNLSDCEKYKHAMFLVELDMTPTYYELWSLRQKQSYGKATTAEKQRIIELEEKQTGIDAATELLIAGIKRHCSLESYEFFAKRLSN